MLRSWQDGRSRRATPGLASLIQCLRITFAISPPCYRLPFNLENKAVVHARLRAWDGEVGQDQPTGIAGAADEGRRCQGGSPRPAMIMWVLPRLSGVDVRAFPHQPTAQQSSLTSRSPPPLGLTASPSRPTARGGCAWSRCACRYETVPAINASMLTQPIVVRRIHRSARAVTACPEVRKRY